MWKQNKYKIIVTTLITLVPMLIGCILWERLPDQIATHFGADNMANDWSSKTFTVFGIPAFLAVLHLVCLFAVSADPKSQGMGRKAFGLMFWIIPSISLFMETIIYAIALGADLDIGLFVRMFFGILFIILGNILPKARQNHSFGFRVPWTLEDEENWRRTHRIGGCCLVIAGVIILETAYMQDLWIFVAMLVASFFIPTIYSYLYYKKHLKDD